MWGAAVLVLAVTVSAALQVSFPFNAQVPPVAHVGEPFNFQFASTTFEPNFATLQYSLTRNPPWLSLDGATRALWGTPNASDVGSPTFTIVAAGAAGAVANMQATLVVVEPGGPTASGDVLEQLLTAGKLSGPSSLALLPSTGFDFKFSTDTFTGNGKNLSYYATLSDHTPLPSWVTFNPESLQFSGSTPQVGASPQSFEILLIASDILGFAGTWITFTLVVSKHTFVFSPWKQTINTTKGATVNFTSLRSHLTLDGGPIVDADLQSATAELPFWLSFDPDNFAVTGTPPSGLTSQDISIEAKDKYGGVANTTIHLAFISPLFSGEVGQLNATVGQDFNYTLGRSIFAQGGEEVSMDFGSAGKWLHFDPTTLSISGKIPAGTAPLDIQVTLMARSTQEKALNDSQTFNIHVIALEAQNPVFGTTTTSIPSLKTSGAVSPTDATGADTTAGSEEPNSRRGIIVVGAIAGSICAVFVVLVLTMFLCNWPRGWRRKPKSLTRPEISWPIIPRPVTGRSTTKESLRGHSLKGSLSSLRDGKTSEDVEMSESTYASEPSLTGSGKKDDDDISGRSVPPPVRLSPARKSGRESKKESKRASPFGDLEPEHGGKEDRHAGTRSKTHSESRSRATSHVLPRSPSAHRLDCAAR